MPRSLVDVVMETRVEVTQLNEVLTIQGGVHLREDLAHTLQVDVRDVVCSSLRGQYLDRSPKTIDLLRIAQTQDRDSCPTIRLRGDEAFPLEHGQGIPDRTATDSKLFSKFGLRKNGAGLYLSA